MQLLIVNDAELTLQFLVKKIDWETYGITAIKSALDAEEAMEIMKHNPIDIILCDIEMPGENGIEFIHWVQEQQYPADTIFLTCHANFDYIHEALHLDCRDYILFPASADSIGQAVLKVVQRRIESQRSATLQNYGQKWLNSTYSMPESLAETSSPQDIIDQTVQYIMQNISSPDLSVNSIAEKHFISLSYLSRIFKKAKGISVSSYIIQTRMDLAASLLRESDAPITNIALEVSYDNYPYFTSTFKKYYGCTPSQYREQNHKKKEQATP